MPSPREWQEDGAVGLQALAEALMSGRGEASGVVIAQQVLRHYRQLEDDDQRSAFFRYVARRFEPDQAKVREIAKR